MRTKNVIIIHGCLSKAEEEESVGLKNKHWISSVRETLIDQGVPVTTPHMPESWKADYKKWKSKFEKSDVNEQTTLIGHSCGCAFLVRWLGDSKRKIDKLILVAPWKIADRKNKTQRMFYEYPIDETIKLRVNKIVIFTSDNEEEDGKKSVMMYHSVLGGRVIELQGRGHYASDDDIKTVEFPELLEEIMSE